MKRRRRGHCTSLLEGSNRNILLRECLIELNLVFVEIFFSFFVFHFYFFLSIYFIQICTYFQYDGITFVRMEELKQSGVKRLRGAEVYEW